MELKEEKEEKKNTSSKVSIFLTASIIITIISNHYLSNGLYNQSLNSIIRLQSQATPNMVYFMNLISFFASSSVLYFAVAVLFVLLKTRIRMMVYLSFFVFNIYFNIVLKGINHEARPFWYSKSIKQEQWDCPGEYGNPSGHSWLVVVFYESLLTDFFQIKSKFLIILKWIFLVFMFVLVPFSRVYLGAHAGNQVFYGFLMGMLLTVFYRYSLQKQLYKLYQYLLISSETKAKLIPFIFIISLQVVTIIIPIFIYTKAPTETSIQILTLNQKCPHNLSSYPKINKTILLTLVWINFFFGLMYGVLNSPPSLKYYMYSKWIYSPKTNIVRNIVLKLLIESAFLVIPLICIELVKKYISGVILQYCFISFITTIGGYLFIKYSVVILKRLNIIKIQVIDTLF